jgi:hypothetical protein
MLDDYRIRSNGRNHRTQITFARNSILQSSGALRLLAFALTDKV